MDYGVLGGIIVIIIYINLTKYIQLFVIYE